MTTVQTAMSTGQAPVTNALAAWKPWAQLPPGSEVRQAVEDFLVATSADARRRALEQGNALFRLQNVYREMELLRADAGEKSREFAALLATSNGDLHGALRGAGSPNTLALLQQAFEFGRGEVHPKYEAVRTCLLEWTRLDAGGPSMKFAMYPNGIIFSGGGKTHEEMARLFVANGYGAGVPQAGGQIFCTGKFTYQFDLSSTAFRANGVQPAGIAAAFQRWIRVTGADESKVRFIYRPPAGGIRS
ncbi:MAG TPA: hypothetical protein VF678_04255 [bacterium]